MAAPKKIVYADDVRHELLKHDPKLSFVIERVKAADAVEVVHGRWIEHKCAEEENGLLVSNYECSVCHSWERDEGYYCPHCGAKMYGGAEDGK